MKAHPLDDDGVRLLAIPFTGPIPIPGTRGVDIDFQRFLPETDVRPDWLPWRPTDWHHRMDGVMGAEVIGKAGDIGRADGPSKEPDEDGWWVTLWLDRGKERLRLVERLAAQAAQIFGSSETAPGMGLLRPVGGPHRGEIIPWRRDVPGDIVSWPYMRQALSTSPQNTHSVLRPIKATLDDLDAAGEKPSASFWSDVEDALRDLGASLRKSSVTGTSGAKAGQERAVREALGRMDRAVARASASHR